jgi:DNA-binding protein H-NS
MPRRSLDSIAKRIKQLDKEKAKLEAARNNTQSKSVAKVVAFMKKLGVSVSDLGGGTTTRRASAGGRPKGGAKAPKAAKPKGVIRFKNESTGETWAGVGRPPQWILKAEKAGKNREEFRVAK